MNRKLSIIVSGMIAADPWQGGATWAVLQYLLGFRALGHDVLFIEPITAKAIRPQGADLSTGENARYFRRVLDSFDLSGNAALLLSGTKQTFGLSYEELQNRTRSADLLLNISGMLTDENLVERVPVRIYLDLDPVFNQLWSAVHGLDMRFAGHTHFVTIGQNIGREDCLIPTCGRKWLKTLQPIVLSHWPIARAIEYDALTTVANWRGYGSIEHNGVHYGQKAHSLRQFLTLPTLTSERFMPALAIHPGETKDLSALAKNGWSLLDPAKVAHDPGAYQQFIQSSKAELGVAKSGYVVSRSGWFSDRSVCYLASGRPVLAQDTGFTTYLPTGSGLFAFETVEHVLHHLEALRGAYEKHCQHARSIAEEHFESGKVLNRLLRTVDA